MNGTHPAARPIAGLAALLLALATFALAGGTRAGAETSFVRAAAEGEARAADGNDPCDGERGAAADNARICDEDGHPGQGEERREAKGDNGNNEPGEDLDCEADPDHPDCDEGGEVPDCEADPDHEDCHEGGEAPDCEADPDHPDCDEGGEVPDCEADPDHEDCENGDGGEPCAGSVAESMHEGDPTGLSSAPTGDGPLSGAIVDGAADTPLEGPATELGCGLSLTGEL